MNYRSGNYFNRNSSPSLSVLYALDEMINPALTVKAIVNSGFGNMNMVFIYWISTLVNLKISI